MPVVHIRAVGIASERIDAVLEFLANDVQRATRIPTGDTWVTFSAIEPGRLAIGTRIVHSSEDGIVFVDIHVRDRPPGVIETILRSIGQSVSDHLQVPLEDVWCRCWVIESGEVLAGGQLVRGWGDARGDRRGEED